MEKELKLKTQWKTQTTTISFGVDYALKTRLKEILDKEERKIAIITDDNVEKLYASQLEHLDLKLFSFPAGETSKTRETKSMLEDNLLSHNFGRDSLIIALGGGVVNDVVGFLASTYCRGVPLIQVPTTLLAMVDSSIGGKTSVNTPYGKNMIGSFYPPQEVWIDGNFLSTLPEKQRNNGIVEMIKAALIHSPSLFDSLHENVKKWKGGDLDFQMKQIYESVMIKKDIVEKDPEEEKGLRRTLNLGHTIGHVLEVLEEYTIEHGEAIAIGILVGCYISQKMGLLTHDVYKKIHDLFKLYQVPLHIPKKHSLDEWMGLLARDKKALQGSPRVVLLDDVGSICPFNGEYCTEIEFPLLDEAIQWMYREFHYE